MFQQTKWNFYVIAHNFGDKCVIIVFNKTVIPPFREAGNSPSLVAHVHTPSKIQATFILRSQDNQQEPTEQTEWKLHHAMVSH